MFSYSKIRNLFSLGLILIINLIFIIKYADQYFDLPILLAVIYTIFFILFISILNKPIIKKVAKFIRTKYFSLSVFIIFISILFIHSAPRFGTVGRLTAIEEWLSLLFKGTYPYTSYITPSAFPFFYFLISPLYFINQLGFLEVMGLALLLLFIKKFSISDRNLIISLFILFTSPILYHDFAVRSELSFNISLIILLSTFLNDRNDLNIVNFLLFGVLFGLVLSTRSVIVVPMTIFLIFYFRSDLKRLFLLGIIVISVFILQMLPLIIWDADLFIEVGPFAIQSHLADLPKWFIALCLIFSFFFGWIVQNIREVFFSTGIILFTMILVSYISKIFEHGFQRAFFGDNFIDLAYLAFAFPFLLFAIEDYKTTKQLGRIL